MFQRRSLQVVFSCAALLIVCDANLAANSFMDDALASMRLMVHQIGLDPWKALAFKVKVKATGITNREFLANFIRGSLYGLESLQRRGDCSYGGFGTLMKLGCYLSLKPAHFLMNADLKGDGLANNVHSISTNSSAHPNTMALVEVHGEKDSFANLGNLYIESISLTLNVTQGKLALNGNRLIEFAKKANEHLSQQLHTTMTGVYAYNLGSVLSRMTMP